MPTHFQCKRELLAASFAALLGSLLSVSASAQAPAPAAPAKAAPAPAAPAPAAATPAATPAEPPAAPASGPLPAPPLLEAAPPAAAAPGVVVEPPPPEAAQTTWGVPPKAEASGERPQIFLGYEITLPVADLRDFTTKASYRGFEMGALWPVYRSLYIGPFFNYHLFYEHKGQTTYLLDSGALTADLYRYAKTWTMGAAARYLFLAEDSLARPYVGLRLGISFVTMATLAADLALYDNPTGFALSPEAGVLLRIANFMSFAAGLRYDFSTAGASDWDNLSYVAYHIGFAFHNRP